MRILLSDWNPEGSTAVDQKLDVNEVIARYGTSLNAACLGRKGQITTKIAKVLLARGADVNIRREREPYAALEILLWDRHKPESQNILGMFYELGVVEAELSKKAAINR